MILENKAAKGWWQAVQKTTEQKAAGRPARLNYKMKTQLQLYALLAPVLILIFIFCYLPLYGLLIAFQEWYPGMPFLDFTGATKWVGLKHFISFFQNPYFWRLIKNTLVLSALNLGVAFWIPIGFALLINELRLVKFKKFAQTASYLPYFISSVVVAGMALSFLSSDGIINKLIVLLGGEPFLLNMKPQYFPMVYTLINIWRNFGWGSILYLSSMASIDTALYEAASLDGANRWHKMWHITLPSIKPTIVVMAWWEAISAMAQLWASSSRSSTSALCSWRTKSHAGSQTIRCGNLFYKERVTLHGSYFFPEKAAGCQQPYSGRLPHG